MLRLSTLLLLLIETSVGHLLNLCECKARVSGSTKLSPSAFG
jgi:hypothetical protein